MEVGKKYEYILEPEEIREFCRKALVDQVWRRKRVWIVLFLILIVDAFLIPEGVVLVALMLAAMLLVADVRNYKAIKEQTAGQRWTLWIEEGRLKSRKSGDYSEIPCGNIQLIRVTRRLLMLGYMQTAKRVAWYVMPLRVFADEREREAFLSQIRNPQQAFAAGVPEEAEQENGQTLLRLFFGMDAEKWVRFYRSAAGLIHAGTLGTKERNLGILFWGVLTAAVMTACVSFAAGGFSWLLVAFSIFITVLMLLRLFFRDPEKNLRKQAGASEAVKRTFGLWQLSFSDTGIAVIMPDNRKNFYAWESLAYLVETQEAFYLFYQDKKRFITVAKESFQSWDQVSTFQGLCAAHGIRTLPARRMRYMPYWVWALLLVLFLAICAAVFVFSIFRNIGF